MRMGEPNRETLSRYIYSSECMERRLLVLSFFHVSPHQAWHNEKFAPELLPPKTEFVSSMLEQMKAVVSEEEMFILHCTCTSLVKLNFCLLKSFCC